MQRFVQDGDLPFWSAPVRFPEAIRQDRATNVPHPARDTAGGTRPAHPPRSWSAPLSAPWTPTSSQGGDTSQREPVGSP